jgi:hypothetical protein
MTKWPDHGEPTRQRPGVLEYPDQGVTAFDQNLHLVTWNQRVKELLDLPDEFFQQHISLESMLRYNAERDEYGDSDIDALATDF